MNAPPEYGNRSSAAFTLLELSIVLVVIGLVVGGVMVGRDLVQAAKLRSMMSQLVALETSVNTFKLKFNCLPGDCRTATTFWGAQDNNDGLDTDCTDIASTTDLTCNGDGNGSLTFNNSTSSYEAFRFWQHLANAGLIVGRYTGTGNVTTPAHAGVTIGVNIPATSYSSVGISIGYSWASSGTVDDYPQAQGHKVIVGQSVAGPTAVATRPFLTTVEALNLDTKIDDGRPGLGSTRSYRFGATGSWSVSSSNCADNTSATLANYDLTQTGSKCTVILLPKY